VKLPDEILAAVERYDEAKREYNCNLFASSTTIRTAIDNLNRAAYALADLVSAWAREER
jgi:hypothetical protein